MLNKLFSFIGSLGVVGFILVAWTAPALAQQEPVDFHKTIKPLFEKYCVSCHGEEETEAFRIDVKADSMDYITPGDADDSQMYQVLITDDENELMPPPDEENPMSAEEIKLVETWIKEGAKWPDAGAEQATEETDQPVTPATSDDLKMELPGAANPIETQEPQAENQLENSPADQAQPAPADQAQPAPAEKDKGDQRIYRAIGSLHPAVLHLPMGLLLAAGLFALLSLRGNFVMSDCAYYCLWLGALGCVLACVTGWWAAPMKFRTEGVQELGDLLNQDHRVFWHRTGGLVVTAVSLVLAMFAASARNRDPDDGMLWKLALILLAGAVGWVGHEGGKLTYGKYHYKDLNELASEWFPSVFGANAPAPQDGQPPLAPPQDNSAEENLDAAPKSGASQPGAADDPNSVET